MIPLCSKANRINNYFVGEHLVPKDLLQMFSGVTTYSYSLIQRGRRRGLSKE